MPPLPEILLVEDRKDDRDLFASAVAASGLRVKVETATEATEVVVRLNRIGRYADAALPALIVLDLRLPGLNGQALLQVIRTAYRSRKVPVVILTGSQSPEDRATCEQLGISDYMVKPQSFSELQEFVASLRRFLPGEEPTPRTSRLAKLPEEMR
ncbi:MAG: response regulator [Planctomycetes bacterium]|nr:response regulator [Planctomycetota bacterium]